MEADADRYGWLWGVAAVDSNGHVSLLDPKLGKRGVGVTLDERAAIDNVLRWLDLGPTQPSDRTRRARKPR
jgi:hypothetical protein